ncbi:MAG: nuclear transport factor 2 family protein [Anaerolineales bacterium]
MSPARLERFEAAIRVVLAFHDAYNRQDHDGVLEFLSDDCVFESPFPLPAGSRFVGKDELSGRLEELFRLPEAKLEAQEVFNAGTRCVLCWKLAPVAGLDDQEDFRGVDIFRVAGGLIREKLAYVHPGPWYYPDEHD